VALDGSKVKANASKHKAMSYGRMEETKKRLREEVQELLNLTYAHKLPLWRCSELPLPQSFLISA